MSGTAARPRMSVFRSNKQIYVQIIDDLSGKTLAAASSLGMTEKLPKKEVAAKVGEIIANDLWEYLYSFAGFFLHSVCLRKPRISFWLYA